MPAGAIEDQQRDGANADLGADFLQMFIHGFGIYRRHDDGGADAPIGTDGTEQVNTVVAIVADHRGAIANLCPDIGVGALLADPGFIGEPHLDGFVGGTKR